MTTTDNKAKVSRFYEEACNMGNLAAIDDLVAPEEINHPYPGDPDSGRGPEATKQFVTTLRTSWPDIRIAVEHQIAEGDWVMTRWTARGTYQGGDPTLPATAVGKPATITGISINRFAGGKSVESWTEYDRLGMLQQLGVMPAQRQVGA
jgi:predicted ester cyclase